MRRRQLRCGPGVSAVATRPELGPAAHAPAAGGRGDAVPDVYDPAAGPLQRRGDRGRSAAASASAACRRRRRPAASPRWRSCAAPGRPGAAWDLPSVHAGHRGLGDGRGAPRRAADGVAGVVPAPDQADPARRPEDGGAGTAGGDPAGAPARVGTGCAVLGLRPDRPGRVTSPPASPSARNELAADLDERLRH